MWEGGRHSLGVDGAFLVSHSLKGSLRRSVSTETREMFYFEVENKEQRVLNEWRVCVEIRKGCTWSLTFLESGGEKNPPKSLEAIKRSVCLLDNGKYRRSLINGILGPSPTYNITLAYYEENSLE
jgi:hypothetical protein